MKLFPFSLENAVIYLVPDIAQIFVMTTLRTLQTIRDMNEFWHNQISGFRPALST